MNYHNINPLQNKKTSNLEFSQQRIEHQNLINASLHAVLEWESCQASFLSALDRMTGIVDKDGYFRMASMYFFSKTFDLVV